MSTAPTQTGPTAVAAGPVDVVLGDIDGNLRRIEETAATRFDAGAHIVVLPELATSGYVFSSSEEARAASIRATDPRLARLARVAPPDGALIVGFAEQGDDALHSSAAVLTRSGVEAVYRKTHLWGDEVDFFAPGDRRPPVVETPAGRIGVAICYDAEFPEIPRGLALDGADVLALPVNWPMVERPVGERPPEIVLAMAAARASRIPLAIADRSGSERGVTWTDGSAIIGPDGWILDGVGGDVAADVRLSETRDKRIGRRNDVFADRRPDLYRI